MRIGLESAGELETIYAAAFGSASEAAAWRVDTLPKHAAREGFRLVGASDADRLVAFGYGYTGEPGQWWTDQIAARVPPAISAEWVGGHFELVELAVLPSHGGRGLGAALHDELLDGLPHRVALLTATLDENDPARRLYRRKGWLLLAHQVFDDADLLGKRLR
ncbi:GNAT family N-acetyltransferase [Actinoplanes sp. CA-142083]|uniref:GNAT family N-acetyltransferase n=1 Tax=Actinoplanes sp. CA-142083 TaxID=3239903 RepID=UPI003D8A1B08